MIINNTLFNCELVEILTELQNQLKINDIPLLQILKDSNSDIMVQCPFHKNGTEKKPSAGIRKSDGQFHCFTCNTTKSLQEVISYCLGYTTDYLGINGWEWLQKNFLSLSVLDRKPIELELSRHANTKNIQYVSEEELDKYRYIHPYMYKRKLTDEIIEMFDIGVDLNTNEITMPNYDKNGKCVFVARRSIKGKRYSYPLGVKKIVYGIYQLYSLPEFPKEVYITESMIDCMYLWVFNKYAVALNGLGTIEQINELNRMPCRKFIIATDNDEAGIRASNRIKGGLKNKLVYRVVFPTSRKDINECSKDEILNLKTKMCY